METTPKPSKDDGSIKETTTPQQPNPLNPYKKKFRKFDGGKYTNPK